MDWLSKLDPNTVVGIFTILGGVATWAWKKARGEKTESFDDKLRGLGKQVIHVLLTDPNLTSNSSLDTLKLLARDQLWKLAAAIRVPRNSLTEMLADNLIEHIVGDVLAELRAREAIPLQLQQLSVQTQAIADLFKNPKPLTDPTK